MNSICIKSNNQDILDELDHRIAKFDGQELCIRKHSFKVFDNIIIHYKGKNIDTFYTFVSKVLSDIIVAFFEPLLIKRLIDLDYFYFNDEDKNIIMDEFNLIKEKDIYDIDYAKNLIYYDVFNYLQSNKILVLSGFVDFRLSNYRKYLEKILAEAVNQYVIDKEYITFVNLLRSYVNSKSSSDDTVNLIYINSNGILLSDDGEYIKLDDFSSSYVTDISFSQNDYVLNTLVGLLPKEIRIHLVSPRDQFIKTIEMIFEDCVHICEGCELCKTYKILQLK